MIAMHHRRFRRALPVLVHVVLPATLAMTLVLVACGKDKSGTDQPGAAIARKNGCYACHSLNGDPGVGPTWKGLYGSTVVLTDGSSVKVDRGYLERAIQQPNAQIPKGTKVPMPPNKLTPDEVRQVVDFIISLK
jgi:cytochrome c oxidase subunit 2